METDYSSLHDEAKRRFAAHPTWKMLRHTPWENDAPIVAAELARDAVASAPSYAATGVDAVAACLERVKQLEATESHLRAQLAEAERRTDEWRHWANSAFIERDAAQARAVEMEGLLREARPLVCSIAADDRNDHWQKAAEVVKSIVAALATSPHRLAGRGDR